MKLNLEHTTKWLLLISLVWIIIDGVFRKWVLPGLSTPIFAIKYVLFGLTYLFFFLKSGFYLPKIKHGYQFFIAIFVAYCFFLLFYNPFKTSLMVQVFGLINYLFFMPLLLLVPYYFNNVEKIEGMMKVLAYLSIPIYIVGIIQYFLPVDHILNYLPNEDQKFNKVAEYTRSLSIFSFVKIYNVYLLFVVSAFLAYIYYLMHKGKQSWFYVILFAFGILSMFMTGSRLPMALIALFTVIILIYYFLNIPKIRKSILVTFIAGVVLSISLYTFSNTFTVAIDAFFRRVEIVENIADKGVKGYSTSDRTIDRIDIFKFADKAGFLGFGIGTTYQGTGMVLSSLRSDISFEEEGERIVLEIGIIGGLLMILLRLTIFLYSLNVLLKIKSISITLLLIPFVLYLSPPLFFLNNNTFNYFDGFSYWFCFSLVLAFVNIYQNQPIDKN